VIGDLAPVNVFSGLEGQATSEPASLDEAARQFEGMMMKMMIKEMRKSIPDGMFSSSGTEMFEDLFDEQLADQIMSGGRGFGLSESITGNQTAPLSPSMTDFAMLALTNPVPGGDDEPGDPYNIINSERVSSAFGLRADPISGEERHHNGLDIAAPEGTPIQAIEDGVVTFAGERGSYGNLVVVSHPDGRESRYAHCSELWVEPGARVRAGEDIAAVGSTGRSTGPHLHIELLEEGVHIDPSQSPSLSNLGIF
jgi:murein DD-endopeptidase MepM/ murein hydrolase activator NlpD